MSPNNKIILFAKTSLTLCAIFSVVFAILRGNNIIELSWWVIFMPFITLYTLVFSGCFIMCLILLIKKLLKINEKNTNIT